MTIMQEPERRSPNNGTRPTARRSNGMATGNIDHGREGSVRAAIIALVLTVISALALFPFLLPPLPT